MRKEIEIRGCIEISPNESQDEVAVKFIEFVEKNGWKFGGGFRTVEDGYYLNEDGTKAKPVGEDT